MQVFLNSLKYNQDGLVVVVVQVGWRWGHAGGLQGRVPQRSPCRMRPLTGG